MEEMSVSEKRPFRFGLNAISSVSREQWRTTARKTEDLGYSTLCVGDHLWTGLAPLTSMMAAAEATTKLRVGSFVFGNDFRHPVVLAREAATIDLLSEGRLELGIGTGWEKSDYERPGITLDSPETRVARFEEAVHIIKELFGSEPVNFSGDYYTINNLKAFPRPVQRPHPPILIGGAGRRILSIAAREANIVSVNIKTTADGNLDWRSATEAATMRRTEWIRQCAGERFSELELNILLSAVIITNNALEAAETLAKEWEFDPNEMSVDDLLTSPYFLFGSQDEIVETLQVRRERYGISYFTIFGEDRLESFAPVLARLVGT
jgi:probable F420-dependent oxidoreductase